MRAAVAVSRFRLLLVVLLALLGTSTAAPDVAFAGQAALFQSATPPIHEQPTEPLRLSATAVHALATALPEGWWAVSPGSAGEATPPGRPRVEPVSGRGLAAATSTPRSSRAPPLA